MITISLNYGITRTDSTECDCIGLFGLSYSKRNYLFPANNKYCQTLTLGNLINCFVLVSWFLKNICICTFKKIQLNWFIFINFSMNFMGMQTCSCTFGSMEIRSLDLTLLNHHAEHSNKCSLTTTKRVFLLILVEYIL